MVLQRLEGLSDREAVERFTFDVRWRYAAGVGGWDGPHRVGFAHTVLVDMRERLRCSDRPDRMFEVALAAARQAGLLGRRRVLDSTPLYDAVATMDTVTLIRCAVRGLLRVAGTGLAHELRAALGSGDDYASTAKPVIDWDDPVARDALVDSRARDGYAVLAAAQGRQVPDAVGQAVRLLATVLGQDLEDGPDGVLRIARSVAPDRVISTVDPLARHGHKTNHRGFDGYNGHLASTRTAKSSPRPRSRRATPQTPNRSPICCGICWILRPPVTTRLPAPRTATRPTAPAKSCNTWTRPASTPG
jgi:hypothetical protein